MLRFIFMLCAGLLFSDAAEASLRAWLDRSEIALGETVTLNIEVQGAGAAAPDFSILDGEFERRGSSSSSQISLSNGQRSAVTLFAVSLQPRREGQLEVPSIQVGADRTPPLALKVGPSPIDTDSGGDVFLEASVSPAELYVQEQAIYSVKLFYAVSLWDGQLEAPAAEGLQAYRLGDDLKYQVERAGRRYSVIERRFALVPQRSGELEVAAARFDGTGLDRGGYGGLLGSAGIRLSARGKPITLTVRPQPAAAATPWLPAESLQIELSGGSLPDEVAMGEPINLGLTVTARGLVPAQLPEIELPEIEGAATYPDQASTRDLSNADGLGAERMRSFAIVPQRAGELRIPPIRLSWWDVAADAARVAELPSRVVRVLPAAGAADGVAANDPLGAKPAIGHGSEGAVQGQSHGWESWLPQASYGPAWPWALLSVLLALGWWRTARRRPLPHAAAALPTPSTPPRLRLPEALRSADPAAAAAALRAAHPGGRKPSLSALAEDLQDAQQKAVVLALEQHLFGAAEKNSAELLAELGRAFRNGPRWREEGVARKADATGFPPLYG